VRRTDARSAGIENPDGVTRSFQVRANNVEPLESVRARNLLAKDDVRRSLGDESEPNRPEVTLVIELLPLSRAAERLAGTRARPHGRVRGPARELERVVPAPDPGEEVRARERLKLLRADVDDGAPVNDTGSDLAGLVSSASSQSAANGSSSL
jgi:hypothetical protein